MHFDTQPSEFIPDWCLANEPRETYYGDRDEACGVWPGTVVLYEIRDDVRVQVGRMNYSLISNVYASPDEGIWYHDYSISNSYADAVGAGVVFATTFGCEGLCDSQNEVTDGTTLPEGLWLNLSSSVDSLVARGDDTLATSTWDGIFSHPDFPIRINDSRTARSPQVRCDRSSVFGYAPGCVLDAWDATLHWYLGQFPTWSWHVFAAQNSGLPGALGTTPLHRLVDSAGQARNRDVACPSAWTRPENMSCDEYPFASTYEGAALSGGAGLRTFSWCQVPEPATPSTGSYGFSSCMIDSVDNSSHGIDLQAQYRRGRVLDGDAFWVDVAYDS